MHKWSWKPNLIVFGYFLFLLVVWGIWELILSPITLTAFGLVGHELIDASLKISLWTVPSVYLLYKHRSGLFVGIKEMFTTKVNWLKYWPFFFGFVMVNITGAYFTFGKISVHESFNPLSLIGSVLFVGITEEMVFRGLLLNATLPKMKQLTAIFLNTVMFLVIHFPIWIAKGIFLDTLSSGRFLIVIALSVIFSMTFIKSKSIFVPIVLHMFWNLLTRLLFG